MANTNNGKRIFFCLSKEDRHTGSGLSEAAMHIEQSCSSRRQGREHIKLRLIRFKKTTKKLFLENKSRIHAVIGVKFESFY